MPIKMGAWLAAGMALLACTALVFLLGYQYSNSRREAEIARLNQTIFTLRESIETANEEADRRAKESAKAAKAIEDERNARIEETTRLFAEYEARADADADEYARRLRALGAKACRGSDHKIREPRVPESTGREQPREAIPARVFQGNVFEAVGSLLGQSDWVNKQFAHCLAIVSDGREISR